MSEDEQDNEQQSQQPQSDEAVEAEAADEATTGGEETELYELGYHLVPTLDEEGVAAKVTEVRSMIEELGGALVSEGYPESVDLAYAMDKRLSGKRQEFSKAYFGWMKFTLAKEKSLELRNACEAHEDIIRHLLIIASRESAYAPPRREERRVAPAPEAARKRAQISEEELDKSIEELVT